MRTTRITAPDGSVTKIQATTFCGGCVTVLCFLAVLAIPVAYFGSWAVAAYVGVPLLILAAGIIWGIHAGRNTHGTPLDEPEKDAAYGPSTSLA